MSKLNVHFNFFMLVAIKLVIDYAGGYYWLDVENPNTAAIAILILNLFVSAGLINFMYNEFKYYFVFVLMLGLFVSNILYPVMLVLAVVIIYLRNTSVETKQV